MALIESKIKNFKSAEFVSIHVTCPICDSRKKVNIPKSIINHSKNLATISIQKDITCKHHFQIFVDKNYTVRGYQKVDFQIESDSKETQKLKKNNPYLTKKENFRVFENPTSIFDSHESRSLIKRSDQSPSKIDSLSKREMSLEEIYEEFKEFIDDTNDEFLELILKDKRRQTKITH